MGDTNIERLARVETQLSGIAATISRIENKQEQQIEISRQALDSTKSAHYRLDAFEEKNLPERLAVLENNCKNTSTRSNAVKTAIIQSKSALLAAAITGWFGLITALAVIYFS